MLVGAVNYNLETLVATADVGTSNNNQNKMGNNEINNFFWVYLFSGGDGLLVGA